MRFVQLIIGYTRIKSELFSVAMKCLRCKVKIGGETFCQECKNILLPYFENTNDWQLAFEMESLRQSFTRYTNAESDINEFSY